MWSPKEFIEYFGFYENIEYGGYFLSKIENIGYDISNPNKVIYIFKLFYEKTEHPQNNPNDFYEEHCYLDLRRRMDNVGNLYDFFIKGDSVEINGDSVVVTIKGFVNKHMFGKDK